MKWHVHTKIPSTLLTCLFYPVQRGGASTRALSLPGLRMGRDLSSYPFGSLMALDARLTRISSVAYLSTSTTESEGPVDKGPLKVPFPSKGKELHLHPSAMAKLKNLSQERPEYALFVVVKFGGCHGFQYDFQWKPSPFSRHKEQQQGITWLYTEETLKVGHHIASDQYWILLGEGSVVVDGVTLDLINGSELAYVEELIGSRFAITENPNVETGCGCGVSFNIKSPS